MLNCDVRSGWRCEPGREREALTRNTSLPGTLGDWLGLAANRFSARPNQVVVGALAMARPGVVRNYSRPIEN